MRHPTIGQASRADESHPQDSTGGLRGGDPSTWDDKLPFIAFAYSTAQQASNKLARDERKFVGGKLPSNVHWP